MNMDQQDEQDPDQDNLRYGKVTQAIIGRAFEVIKELGAGFVESGYEKGHSDCTAR